MMLYKSIVSMVILCISFIAKGQSPKMYKDIVFSAITVDKDQNYSDGSDAEKLGNPGHGGPPEQTRNLTAPAQEI